MNAADLISPGYASQLQEMHRTRSWGKYGATHKDDILAFAADLGAVTILDFGSGKGRLRQALGDRVTNYDPGIPEDAAVPGPADLVVCTDVLEHVEPDRLDATLAFLARLARRGAYLIIATSPSREILPDGRNAHLVIQPMPWWIEKLKRHGFKIARTAWRKGLIVWCAK